MSKRYGYQREGETPLMSVEWLFYILAVPSLMLWWAIIYLAISWLWK